MKSKILFILLFFSIFRNVFCQELQNKNNNFLRNHSFEQFDMPIPCSISKIEHHVWDWFGGYQDTPDVLHIKSLNVCGDNNLFDERLKYIQPNTGNVAIGLRYDIRNVRSLYAGEYIYSKIKEPLVVDSWYKVKLKAANYIKCKPQSLTICLSINKPNSEKNLKLGKQYTFDNADSTVNKWKDFEIVFQANEKYQFIAIGGINIDNYNRDTTLCSSYIIDDVVLEKIETKEISININFDVNKATISPPQNYKVEELYENVKEAKYIEINAHTDNIGNQINNKNLSVQRAETIANFLIKKGISKDIIVSKGYGSEQPTSSNDTKEGRALNRRVEIKIIQ